MISERVLFYVGAGEGSLTGDKIDKNLEIFHWTNHKTIIIIADPQGTSSRLGSKCLLNLSLH